MGTKLRPALIRLILRRIEATITTLLPVAQTSHITTRPIQMLIVKQEKTLLQRDPHAVEHNRIQPIAAQTNYLF